MVFIARDSSGSTPEVLRPGICAIGSAAFLLILNLILVGCGGAWHRHWPKPDEYRPTAYELHSVPFYSQKDHQCGPAALAMTLEWSGIPATPDQLTPEVYTPSRKGSLQSAMIAAARRHSRVAYPISGPEAMLEELEERFRRP